MTTAEGDTYLEQLLKLFLISCVPRSDKELPPGWLCPCGRDNPHYTHTCVCGRNKKEQLPVRSLPSQAEAPQEEAPQPRTRQAFTATVEVDRSGETITCPNCGRSQNKSRTFCYNCSTAFHTGD